MKHTLYTFTRISNRGTLKELEHFGREEYAEDALEKSVARKLDYLQECGWDINGEKVSVERRNGYDGHLLVVVNYGDSYDTFQITERTIEFESYIV